MTWWILTYLHNDPGATTLDVAARTNYADHLFMAWATWKPARHPVYRTVRGKRVLCGYKYIWDTPNIHEQWQPGDTLQHDFALSGLAPGATIWYYLFAPNGPYGNEIQGPLISVTLRSTMPGARVGASVPQAIPNAVITPLIFDVVHYDDGGFFDPASPTLLTAPLAGRYLLGGCLEMAAGNAQGYSLAISSIAIGRLVHHNQVPPANAGWTRSIQCMTIFQLAAGDSITLLPWQNSGGPLDTHVRPFDSPALWIQYVGPPI